MSSTLQTAQEQHPANLAANFTALHQASAILGELNAWQNHEEEGS